MAKMPEFIETYSDDILYLIDARKALLTHPFRTEIKTLCDASFCRLLAVFMIGSIEAMLQYWKERDKKGILKNYFKENASNGARVRSLYDAFRKAGINVDRQIFEDYLAIKYLRNIVVHARWKPNEKELLEKRGFPTDTRKLTEEHWHRMLETNQNMMMYIALTGIPELVKRVPKNKTLKIAMEKEEELKPMIIKRKDLPFLIRRSLGNITAELYESIEKAATSEKYDWSKGIQSEELEKLSGIDLKRLFYKAAKEASREGFTKILNCKPLISDVLFFWNLYKQETFTKNNIQENEVSRSLRTLIELHKRKSYPRGPFLWDKSLPKEVKLAAIKSLIKSHGDIPEKEIIQSLDIGKLVYKFMVGIPIHLFAIYLPIIDPKAAKTLIKEVKFILNSWKLSDAWYFYVEKHEPPNMLKWDFYETLFNELVA